MATREEQVKACKDACEDGRCGAAYPDRCGIFRLYGGCSASQNMMWNQGSVKKEGDK